MNTVAKGAGGIVYEVVGDVLRFPVWWYTAGVVHVIVGAFRSWQGYARSLGILVWIKNIFVPMFGQHDWQGRIISVFMRSVQIVGRTFVFCIFGVMLLLGVVVYIALPIVAVSFIVYHLLGGLVA